MTSQQRTTAPQEGSWRAALNLLIHLRLHFQLIFLSPLFLWGFLLAGAHFSARFFIGFLAFHVFLYGGLTAFNSFYDRDEGPVGGLKHPPRVTQALFSFSIVVQLVGLLLAFLVNLPFAIIYLIVVALSTAYSHPALRWKARPIVSLLVVAFGQGTLGFLAGWLCSTTGLRGVLTINGLLGAAVATLSTVGLYPLTQVYQIDEDRRRGDQTFAVAFGPRASFGFALACLALSGLCIVPLIWRMFSQLEAFLVGGFYLVLLGIISRWSRTFHAGDIEGAYDTLQRVQYLTSVGLIGYIAVRLVLAGLN